MKIKSGFIVRKVADCFAVIAVGSAAKNFRAVITLNESGKLLWEKLALGCEKSDLTKLLLDTYEVDEARAEEDVDKFLNKLKGADILVNE